MNETKTMIEHFHQLMLVFVEALENRQLNSLIHKQKSLPRIFDGNNWLKLIVSEEETWFWRAVELMDDNVVELSDDDDVSKRKFSNPGGGPSDLACDEQTRSLTCWRKTSSNVEFWGLTSSFACSSVGFDGVVETIDETKRTARSASVNV